MKRVLNPCSPASFTFYFSPSPGLCHAHSKAFAEILSSPFLSPQFWTRASCYAASLCQGTDHLAALLTGVIICLMCVPPPGTQVPPKQGPGPAACSFPTPSQVLGVPQAPGNVYFRDIQALSVAYIKH